LAGQTQPLANGAQRRAVAHVSTRRPAEQDAEKTRKNDFEPQINAEERE
jgi:hypothetical protein